MERERRRVLYEGRVQGVGFRFTAAGLASGAGVSGSVRNLPDGRVELDVQGEPVRVRDFLESIRSAMGAKIHRYDETELQVDADEGPDDFQIRY